MGFSLDLLGVSVPPKPGCFGRLLLVFKGISCQKLVMNQVPPKGEEIVTATGSALAISMYFLQLGPGRRAFSSVFSNSRCKTRANSPTWFYTQAVKPLVSNKKRHKLSHCLPLKLIKMGKLNKQCQNPLSLQYPTVYKLAFSKPNHQKTNRSGVRRRCWTPSASSPRSSMSFNSPMGIK